MSSASRNISTIMRVALGILFLAHGIAKFQMGLGNVAGWFASIGVPGFLGYVVAVIELAGGIALILGLLTRYVSALLVIVLIGAIFTTKLSSGLMGNGQGAGYELDIAFILVALHLVFAPTTRLSLDSLVSRRESTEK